MGTSHPNVPDVRKTVIVNAPLDEAFRIFAERPIEWWPEEHVFVDDRTSIVIEPRKGGRYYETAADGTEVAWGTIVDWAPPKRIEMTWRVGPGWQPIFDDERASRIEVEFTDAGAGRTEVALTHKDLHRHGEIAERIHQALQGPSPGPTLERVAAVVNRHATAGSGS